MLISRARQAAINKRDKMSSKSLPKDAQVMTAILKEMGVNEHDPRLINQMLEFTYRYVTDILDDAKVYSNHANKKNIDSEDVKLALQCRLDHSFTTPPPRDLLMDVARHKNTTPLPLIKPYTGPKLPPDRYCLSSANYKLKTLKKPRVQLQSGTTLVTTPRFSLQQPGRGVQLVSRQVSQPSVAIRSSTPSSAMPIIRVTPGATPASSSANESATNPLKRKLEDDDYDN